MKYRVEVDRNIVVPYLGTFYEDQSPYELSEEDGAWFQRGAGVPLLQDNLPEGVTLTVLVGEGEEK